ncbi:hypothetical protein Gogos_001845 [Gossypium gossypioides]|uniref:TCP domain-containing protein n=1 Tax=Gossypium gossypioides TaxID=34282 RepID=A0A7J9CQ55_GOSGO|nr:hypothetical protein [Gossypium gossypioides]
MIPSSEEAGSPIQEGKEDESSNKVRKGASTSSPLLSLKDPRIVRVSRAFGGKDRHSKVFTIRGLRDRRVRLSVPTAIQLYDLQDRLGLNQPSKVVDWLLNEAKHEIEELPPLPIPQGNFALNPQMPLNASQQPNKQDPTGGFWRAKSKDIVRESSKGSKRDEEASEGHQVQTDYGLQRSNHSPMPALSNNAVSMPLPLPMPMPYGSYYHFEPSNFPLPHLGSHGFVAPQTEEVHNFNVVPLSSTLSLSSGSQNHFQMLSSGAQNPFANLPQYSITQPDLRPFHLSIAPRLLPHSLNINGSQPGKEDEFPSK